MRDKGVRFIPIYGRQAFKIEGKFKFWGGLTVEAVGGGPGLIKMLTEAATRRGIEVHYQTRALKLLFDGVRVGRVRIPHDGAESDLRSKSVVLACGGFESNSEWRTRYLGPGWDLAKVRGTRFNNGDGIRMAVDSGASPRGNWSGCHAVQWEMNAPEFGDLAVGDQFQKHSYPFAILVNATGKRFVDEGADFRNYTYAKYGRVVLEQPGQFAWQIFDQKVKHLQRDEYQPRLPTDPRPLCRRRSGRRIVLFQLSGRLRPHFGGRIRPDRRRLGRARRQELSSHGIRQFIRSAASTGRGVEGIARH